MHLTKSVFNVKVQKYEGLGACYIKTDKIGMDERRGMTNRTRTHVIG